MTVDPKDGSSPLFTRGEAWDRFIDELDRCGQAGTAASVMVPELSPDLPSGTRFTDLTKSDVERLSRYATSLGRRGETIRALWSDLRRKPPKPRKPGRRS